MKTAKEIIASITEEMFLTEPLMFDVFCSHKLLENLDIQIMFRTGRGRIEYNPSFVEQSFINDGRENVEIALKNEILRILLLHPYQRVPDNPNRTALKKASDITIYSVASYFTNLPYAGQYNLDYDLSYEEYYKKLKLIFPELGMPTLSKENKQTSRDGYGMSMLQNNSDDYESTELWSEDFSMCDKVEQQIKKASVSNQWGSLDGSEIETILAQKNISIDYKKILMKFRSSVLSDSRTLTRLRPNRRYDFDYMGSHYKPSFNLLVAVDSSGSILHKDLENFFSIINRFFKYGAKEIKVIVFDVVITQELDFKKARKEIEVHGREGTCFQPAIDYYEQSKDYDGLIVFTDGFAEVPKIHCKKKILWVLNKKENYKYNQHLQTLPGCSATWISSDA